MRSLITFLGIVVGVFALPRPGKLENVPSGSYLPGVGSESIVGQALTATTLSGLGGGFVGGLGGGLATGLTTGGFATGYTDGIIDGNLHHEQRHFYFYSAPDDEPAAHLRVYVEPTSQRNTKVIFIKAPSYGGVIPEIIAPPSEAVDKTKVYVLVKKPEHGGAITIPASLGVKQAQPEVFYIKYKHEHEAEAAVKQGLHGAHVGAPLENLGNEQTFVRTLGAGHGITLNGGHGVTLADSISVPGPIIANSHIKYGPPGESGPYKKK